MYLQASRFLIWSHEDACLWRFDEAFCLLVLSAEFCGEEVRSAMSVKTDQETEKYVFSEQTMSLDREKKSERGSVYLMGRKVREKVLVLDFSGELQLIMNLKMIFFLLTITSTF